MPSEKDLTLRHKSVGADKSVADLKAVTKAEDDLRRSVKELGQALSTGKATAISAATDRVETHQSALRSAQGAMQSTTVATNQSAVGFSNIASSLSAVNPMLGMLGGVLRDVSQGAEILSRKNLSLNELYKKGISLAKEHAGALKLLGAGGAAFLAVFALVKVWQAMAEAIKKATEAAEAFERSQRKIGERRESIREALIKRTIELNRGLTEEEVREKTDRAFRLVERGRDPSLAIDIALGIAKETETQARMRDQFFGPGGTRRERQAASEQTTSGVYGAEARRRLSAEFGIEGEELESLIEAIDKLRTAREEGLPWKFFAKPGFTGPGSVERRMQNDPQSLADRLDMSLTELINAATALNNAAANLSVTTDRGVKGTARTRHDKRDTDRS